MALMMEKGKTAGILIRGLVLAGAVSVALLLMLALIMLKLQPDTNKLELGVLFVYALSCLAGGGYSGRKMGRRKFIWGLATGVLYFALLLVVSGMSDRETGPELTRSLAALAICGAGGMLGGMLVG